MIVISFQLAICSGIDALVDGVGGGIHGGKDKNIIFVEQHVHLDTDPCPLDLGVDQVI